MPSFSPYLSLCPGTDSTSTTRKTGNLLFSPTSGKAAAVITIGGTGFLPGEEIEIVMTVGDIHHGLGTEKVDKIVANEYGAFSVASGIPVGTPPGKYTTLKPPAIKGVSAPSP